MGADPALRARFERIVPAVRVAGGRPNAGAIGDIAGRPEIHPQWQYFFAVESLDAALALVRERGGVMIGSTGLPDGRRIAACEDPQGAAFGLVGH